MRKDKGKEKDSKEMNVEKEGKKKRKRKEKSSKEKTERKLEDVIEELKRLLTKRKVKKSRFQRNEQYYEGGKTPPLLTAETIERIWLDNRALKKYIITKYQKYIIFNKHFFIVSAKAINLEKLDRRVE